jgi:hypothetical protein
MSLPRMRLAIVASAVSAAVAAGAAQTPQQTPPVFRTTSTLVAVDVSVRSGNNTVTGLSATDFLLTDNGVAQSIELVDLATVPVDVSLVVDVSGSTASRLNQYRSDVTAIAKVIRPQDRLRIITFATDPKEIMALQPPGGLPAVDDMNAGFSSSVYDGIAAALIRRVDLDRRHLIVAFTDGQENSSILTLEMLADIAKQSEAVLHLSGSSGPLNDVAELTGGSNHAAPMPLVPVSGSMLGDFKKIFEAFRQSYVLRYRPTNVPPAGWHDIKVSLVRKGRFDIRARRGYFGG